jgi:hypothetical protein
MVMIPQIHDDKIQDGKQLPFPVEEKQMSSPIEKRSEPTPTSPRRWIYVLLTILGVALPMIAGSMVWWPWGVPDIFDAEWVFWTVVLGTGLLAFVGAALLRSPWALLIVPVAWISGEFLGAVVRPLVDGGWTALQAEIHFWDAQGTIIQIGVLPVILCTLLGTGIGMWLKERQKRR